MVWPGSNVEAAKQPLKSSPPFEGWISIIEGAGEVDSQAKDIELNAKGISHNKDKLVSLEELEKVGDGSPSSANVFKEINEQKLREANLIIHNLPEPR